jgi:hypothetical protein
MIRGKIFKKIIGFLMVWIGVASNIILIIWFIKSMSASDGILVHDFVLLVLSKFCWLIGIGIIASGILVFGLVNLLD